MDAKTNEKLKFIVTLFDGEVSGERPVEIQAADAGLVLDGIAIIPWEWVDSARRLLQYGREVEPVVSQP